LIRARRPARPAGDPDDAIGPARDPAGGITAADPEHRHALADLARGRAAVDADRADRLMASAPPLPGEPDSEPGEPEVPILPGEPEAPPEPDPVAA
jgi:hypothetical protein